MNYTDQVEKIGHRAEYWYRIKGDEAFLDVVDGYLDHGQDKYFAHTKSSKCVVQAGGYCGIFPRYLSEQFDVVYTFEPDPLNFFCLTLNCQKNNVIKIQGALDCVDEKVSVVMPVLSNRGMNYVYHSKESFIPTFTIDSLGLEECSMIMLDTEGYEFNVLNGAVETIRKFNPVVSVEDTNENIVKLLESLGPYKKVDTVFRDTIYAV